MNYPQEKIKPYNADEKKSVQVEKMFDNIAPAYDQLNHALSWNIDKSWRRKAINWLEPFHPQHIMDVATGTGDFAIQACQTLHPQELIGTDISEGMMNVGREKVKAAGLEIAEKSYTRVKNLHDQGVMSTQKLDEVTAQRNAARATEKAAKAQYDMAKNGAEREDKAAAAALVERAKEIGRASCRERV